MKILLHGLNYAPEKIGIAVYSTGMAQALSEMGHEVRVVAGRPYYPDWRQLDGQGGLAFSRTSENGVSVLRVPHYIPRRPSGVRRLLHHASFALSSAAPLCWTALRWRPDVVVAVAPSMLAAPIAAMAAQIAGAPSWLHVQDLELDAAVATGLLRPGRAMRVARAVEKAIVRRFSVVSSISEAMCRRLGEKGARKTELFRNWADLPDQPTPPATPATWQIDTPHVALYSGAVGNKQGIEIILEAARLLTRRDDLTLVVCASGPGRERLEAQDIGLPNLRFLDLQPADRLGDLLSLATVHLLPQLAEAADLVLPSKLTNMLASGRPTVATAAPGTALAAEIADCGIVTPPGDAAAFATAIERLLDDEPLRRQLSENARQRARTHWDKSSGLQAFERQLRRLVAGRQRPGRRTAGQVLPREGK